MKIEKLVPVIIGGGESASVRFIDNENRFPGDFTNENAEFTLSHKINELIDVVNKLNRVSIAFLDGEKIITENRLRRLECETVPNVKKLEQENEKLTQATHNQNKRLLEVESKVNKQQETMEKNAECFNERHEIIRQLATKLDMVECAVDKLLKESKEEKKEPELLPCPWCQSNAEINISEYSSRYDIACSNSDCTVCPALQDWFDTKQEAIDAWNLRA